MYLYIEPLACLLPYYFSPSYYIHTFRSLVFFFSPPLVSIRRPCNSLLSFSLFLIIRYYLRFASVWSHFAYLSLSLIYLSHPTPPRPRSLSLSLILHTSSALSASLYLSHLSYLYSLSRPVAHARADTYRRDESRATERGFCAQRFISPR